MEDKTTVSTDELTGEVTNISPAAKEMRELMKKASSYDVTSEEESVKLAIENILIEADMTMYAELKLFLEKQAGQKGFWYIGTSEDVIINQISYLKFCTRLFYRLNEITNLTIVPLPAGKINGNIVEFTSYKTNTPISNYFTSADLECVVKEFEQHIKSKKYKNIYLTYVSKAYNIGDLESPVLLRFYGE